MLHRNLLLAAALIHLASLPASAAVVARMRNLPIKFEVSRALLDPETGGVSPFGQTPRHAVKTLADTPSSPFEISVVLKPTSTAKTLTINGLRRTAGDQFQPVNKNVEEGVEYFLSTNWPQKTTTAIIDGAPFLVRSKKLYPALESLRALEQELFGDSRIGRDWFAVLVDGRGDSAVSTAQQLSRTRYVERVIVEHDLARLIAQKEGR